MAEKIKIVRCGNQFTFWTQNPETTEKLYDFFKLLLDVEFETVRNDEGYAIKTESDKLSLCLDTKSPTVRISNAPTEVLHRITRRPWYKRLWVFCVKS